MKSQRPGIREKRRKRDMAYEPITIHHRFVNNESMMGLLIKNQRIKYKTLGKGINAVIATHKEIDDGAVPLKFLPKDEISAVIHDEDVVKECKERADQCDMENDFVLFCCTIADVKSPSYSYPNSPSYLNSYTYDDASKTCKRKTFTMK
jgi:hypothetical protein